MALTKLNNQSLVAVTAAGIPIRSGSVLQAITAEKTESFDVTTSLSDVGLSASITPSSSNSKILVLHSATGISLGSGDAIVILLRGSTTVYNFNGYASDNSWDSAPTTFSYLDSPATTSAITYKIQARKGAGTFYYCYTNTVPSQATLTLMEIAG
jgi:hypothetical protein